MKKQGKMLSRDNQKGEKLLSPFSIIWLKHKIKEHVSYNSSMAESHQDDASLPQSLPR